MHLVVLVLGCPDAPELGDVHLAHVVEEDTSGPVETGEVLLERDTADVAPRQASVHPDTKRRSASPTLLPQLT